MKEHTIVTARRLLLESDAKLASLEREWKHTGDKQAFEAMLAHFKRAGVDWGEKRYKDDLKEVAKVVKKYKWEISSVSDTATSKWWGTPNWRVASVYISSRTPDVSPWPEITTVGLYSIWTIFLYYPSVDYIRKSNRHIKEMWYVPDTLSPKDFSYSRIPAKVEKFVNELERKFAHKRLTNSRP